MSRSVLLFILLSSCVICSAQPSYTWARSLGGADLDAGRAQAVDATNHLYTAGSFEGTADFDPGAGTMNLAAAGLSDVFVCKLDAFGNLVWARSMGGANDESARAIAVDASGNVYITGFFFGTVDLDPGPATLSFTSNAGTHDIFIVKLDVSGNLVWAKVIGGPGTDNCNSVAVGPSGDLYIAGNFNGTVDFDPDAGVQTLTAAGSGAYICRFNAAGNLTWAKGISNIILNSMVLDGSGNPFFTGTFSSSVDIDPDAPIYTLTATGANDIFVAKLNASGSLAWAKSMGGASGDVGNELALDATGNVYVTGFFQATVDFDPGPAAQDLTAAGSIDVFICKLDGAGNYVWAKAIGGTGSDYGYSLKVDRNGNVLAAGYFMGTADLDPGTGTQLAVSAGGLDLFITMLDAAGNYVWSAAMGGSGSDIIYSIAVDGAGNLFATGYFNGTVDMDPGAAVHSLTAVGSGDAFVVRFDAPWPLPLSKLSLKGSDTGSGIQLQWSVEDDRHISLFSIERSLDGNHFIPIGKMLNGSSADQAGNYHYTDLPPQQPVIYYRLQLFKTDGTSTFSDILAVRTKSPGHKIGLLSNPVNQQLYLSCRHDGPLTVCIKDAAGRMVKQPLRLIASSGLIALSVADLPAGTYFVLVQDITKNTGSLRFIKE